MATSDLVVGAAAVPAVADPGFLARWMASRREEAARVEGAVAEQEEVVSGIQRLSVLHAKGTGVSDVVRGLRQESVGT